MSACVFNRSCSWQEWCVLFLNILFLNRIERNLSLCSRENNSEGNCSNKAKQASTKVNSAAIWSMSFSLFVMSEAKNVGGISSSSSNLITIFRNRIINREGTRSRYLIIVQCHQVNQLLSPGVSIHRSDPQGNALDTRWTNAGQMTKTIGGQLLAKYAWQKGGLNLVHERTNSVLLEWKE